MLVKLKLKLKLKLIEFFNLSSNMPTNSVKQMHAVNQIKLVVEGTTLQCDAGRHSIDHRYGAIEGITYSKHYFDQFQIERGVL
jgi:hypothetical protein